MELAFLLRGVGTQVVWITNQKPSEPDEVVYSLERKMLDRGVQVTFIYFNSLYVIMNRAGYSININASQYYFCKIVKLTMFCLFRNALEIEGLVWELFDYCIAKLMKRE